MPSSSVYIANFTTSFKTLKQQLFPSSLSQEEEKMAPSGWKIKAATTTKAAARTKRTATTTTTTRISRHPRRTNFKKNKQNKVNKKQEKMKSVLPSVMSSEASSSKEGEIVEIAEVIDDDDVSNNNSVCSTPKGQRFKIPEISTCPPAPKKKRVISSNCSLRRSPLSFFSHPDLELFFFMALRDVSF